MTIAKASTASLEIPAKNDDSSPTSLRMPRNPASWYFIGLSKDLPKEGQKPLTRKCLSRELIAFRTSTGKAVVMDARCCHMGANLGAGCVTQDSVECPLHGWRFGEDGSCQQIPQQNNIPAWAKQRVYPTAERFGHVFFFNGRAPLFELPTFDGLDEKELLAAAPYRLQIDCPWYMVAANAFDTQHFKMSHERELCGEPTVEKIGDHALRVQMKLKVAGNSVSDYFISKLAGKEITFTITDWGGTFLLVTAEFARTTSYGLAMISPMGLRQTAYENTILIRRRKNRILRYLFDPIDVRIRRHLIRNFNRSDISRIEGTHAAITRCIDSDRELAQYFTWANSLNENNVS
jgi:phenylpropionate dioxygenase-like ring-hydroxylating dioxygenase large terminal subunit